MNRRVIGALIGAMTVLGSAAAQAQMSSTAPNTAPPAKHHGFFGLFGHRHTVGKPGSATTGSTMGGSSMGTGMATGQIIGNKNSKVYHLAGDKNLPAPKNRVYFQSVGEATAAGYHAAGIKTGGMKGHHTGGMHMGTMGSHGHMHGTMNNGTTPPPPPM